MRSQLFGLVVFSWAALVPLLSDGSEAPAPERPRSPSLLQRLDDFTTDLFSGDRAAKPPKSPAAQKSLYRTTPPAHSPQPSLAPTAEPQPSKAAASTKDVPATVAPPASPTDERPPKRFVRSNSDEESSASERPASPSLAGLPPLHERLSGFRQSLFGKGAETPAESKPAETKPTAPKDNAPAPSTASASPAPSPTQETASPPAAGSAAEPTPLVAAAPRPVTAVPRTAIPLAAPPAGPPTSPALMPGVVAPVPAAPVVLGAPTATPLIAAPAAVPATSRPMIAGPTIASPAGSPTLPDRARAGSDDSAVFTRQSPVLTLETVGPRRISVGKEAAYEIVVRNTGEIAADQVMVTIDVPNWTEVTGAQASVGAASPASAGQSSGAFLWKVGRIEARGREKLVLRVVPRQSRPFDLAVKWDCTPAASQGLIEVQEPRLAVALAGPREVLFGKGEIYKLEVSNTGNGDAENVMVSLAPSGPGEKAAAATHPFGKLAAGQKKSIDVELTARQVGRLTIAIEARGDAGLKTELTEEILVRRAALKAEIEAPKVQYVGAESTYRIRVSNPGTAPASRPVVTVTLPAGAQFVSSPQTHRAQAEPNQVVWNLESIPAGSEAALVMVCRIVSPGMGRFEVKCSAEGDLSAAASAVTQVEAMANLVLTIDEPSGPVPVSGEALFQLNLQNRGTATAEGVEVVTYFSNGIEPLSAEGARSRIGPGQVVFDVIPSVAANQTMVLKVKAKAEAAGNYVFRVEVHSRAAGTRLVREGTTRFYGTKEAQAPAAVAQPGAPGASTAEDPRTARH